jgi:hypothetical protein
MAVEHQTIPVYWDSGAKDWLLQLKDEGTIIGWPEIMAWIDRSGWEIVGSEAIE